MDKMWSVFDLSVYHHCDFQIKSLRLCCLYTVLDMIKSISILSQAAVVGAYTYILAGNSLNFKLMLIKRSLIVSYPVTLL